MLIYLTTRYGSMVDCYYSERERPFRRFGCYFPQPEKEELAIAAEVQKKRR